MGNEDIMVKKSIDILSFDRSEKRSILPPKGKKSVKIHMSIMREIKVSTSHFDKIVSTLIRSRKIKFSGKDIPTNKLIVFKDIHNTINTFVGPKSSRTDFSQGNRFTLVEKIPPY